MLRQRLLLPALPIALAAAFGVSCEVERPVEHEGGMHPPGFADKDSPDFHQKYLQQVYHEEKQYPLATCRECHGDDYSGGDSGASCNKSGCHDQAPGVEFCGTCHGGHAPPQPTSGSHQAHTFFGCENCHHVPTDAREVKHPDGQIEVTLSGLAAHGGLPASWKPEDRRCSTTYCHGDQSPIWESPPAQLPCDACHQAPPDNHVQFAASIGKTPGGCETCHPAHDDPRHLDGKIEILEPTCDACHGTPGDAAPPRGIDGATASSARSVGAHQRHIDATLEGRTGKVVDCATCHEVPTSVLSPGHLDTSAPADVHIWGASYEPSEQRCVAACHWNKDPGPRWTDDQPGAVPCGACHGYPPAKTREGVPHPQVEADIDTCRTCHQFAPETHVDGHVDFLP